MSENLFRNECKIGKFKIRKYFSLWNNGSHLWIRTYRDRKLFKASTNLYNAGVPKLGFTNNYQ